MYWFFAVGVVLFLAYTIHYLLWIGELPQLHYKATTFNKELLSGVPSLCSYYWPSFLVSNCHPQTLLGVLARRRAHIPFYRECFALKDGTELHLDWMKLPEEEQKGEDEEDEEQEPPRPTVIVLHGLAGSSRSRYIRQFLKHCRQRRFRCVVVHARGCGDSELRTPHMFYPGLTDDIRQVIPYIRASPRVPKRSRLYAVAFSMGANVLGKYLGEDGVNVPLDGACLFSNPWNLVEVSQRLQREWGSKLYSKLLRIEVLGYIKRHWHQLSKNQQIQQDVFNLLSSSSLYDIDKHLSIRMFGYATNEEYYRSCSSQPHIGKTAIPTLCVNAMDDPLCPYWCAPFEATKKNENLIVVTTKRGGHCAWLEGWDFWEDAWMDRVCSEYILSLEKLHPLKDCSPSK
ncbi:medium-chain fatty acid ethyl ester synthase/esterase 2 [Balamuthia mandrillaris]